MSIEWAPIIDVPLRRRLQILAAAFQIWFLLCGEIVCCLVFAVLLLKGNYVLQTLTVLYAAFIFYDRRVGDVGGRGAGWQWLRSLVIWKYFVEYFPMDLVKTVDLSPNRNYIFALFPHGILSSGPFGNFNTNHTKWRQLFPGIRSKLMTLNFHFYIPFFREVLLGLGMASASSNSIRMLLAASNEQSEDGYTSNGVMIVVGGAQEAFHARPKNYTVVLKRRKGFVKIALQTGTPIVPVISFNEVDIFSQAESQPGSIIRRFQEFVKQLTGVSPIMFMGRGFFQYSFGWIPQRRPITTVVGAPIELVKNEHPNSDEIEELHARFCTELTALFESNKSKYIENSENIHLVIE